MDDPRGKEQTVLFKLIAFLSWHPTATSLNEGNLIVATLTIFVAFDVVTEMYHRLRGQPSSFTTRDKTDFRRRFYIQCVLSLIGWTTVGLIKFRHDIETMVVFIGFGLISCAFFWFEYSIRSLLDSIDWHKVLSAVKTTE
ncbi:hypothetical protein KC959_01055 [Candidatus Saccharibacteria bacterium]|nr:hypothetical protein [Candidatus Saccharibacteria bacterium]